MKRDQLLQETLFTTGYIIQSNNIGSTVEQQLDHSSVFFNLMIVFVYWLQEASSKRRVIIVNYYVQGTNYYSQITSSVVDRLD